MSNSPSDPLVVEPIGYISTPFSDRSQAPRQPGVAERPAEGVIKLLPGRNFEQALEDLDGFERIWVIYWFDRNSGWRPKVLPPRSDRRRRGLFATRSPHRPNPIGLSLLRLLDVRGRTLRVADVDLLDNTPILDIKPYIPYAEAFPDSRVGWLEEAIASDAVPFTVEWSPRAMERARWLFDAHAIDLAEPAERVLRRDPFPHPYRRIERIDGERYEFAVKSWRLRFRVDGRHVVILDVASGYSRAALDEGEPLHDEAAHRRFHELWGE